MVTSAICTVSRWSTCNDGFTFAKSCGHSFDTAGTFVEHRFDDLVSKGSVDGKPVGVVLLIGVRKSLVFLDKYTGEVRHSQMVSLD